MEIKNNVKLHNKFVIEVRDAETNELKQTATSYNIILDAMYTRLCAGSTFFNHIHFGTGTGTPTPERTSLFTRLGTKPAVTESIIRDTFPVTSYTRKIVINPEEFVGSTFREVGIAFSSTSTNLVTHSMIKDEGGFDLEITKTATDVLIIFATIYATFDISNPNLIYLGLPNSNILVNYLVAGSSMPTDSTIRLDEVLSAVSSLGISVAPTYTADTVNRRRNSSVVRFATTVGNGHTKFLTVRNLFSLELPSATIYPGSTYSNVALGTGDGTKTQFILPSLNIRNTPVVKVNGNTVSNYTINQATDYYSLSAMTVDANNIKLSRNGLFFVYTLNNSVVVGSVSMTKYEVLHTITFGTAPVDAAITSNGLRLFVYTPNEVIKVQILDLIGSEWVLFNTLLNEVDIPTFSTSNIIIKVRDDDNAFCLAELVGVAHIYEWSETSWIKLVSPLANFRAISNNFQYVANQSSTSSSAFTYKLEGNSWISHGSFSYTSSVTALAISNCGLYVLTCGHQMNYRFYQKISDTWTYVALTTNPNITTARGVAISSDSKFAVYMGFTSGELSLFDISGPTPEQVVYRSTSAGYAPTGYVDIADNYAVSYKQTLATSGKFSLVEFSTPPAVGDVITADYTVDGIHKTDQYVIDASFSIQFGEGSI